MQQAKGLETKPNQNHRILAHAIAHIRKGKGPLAIVFDEEQLSLPGQPLRWFALALLTCLPPKVRAGLRLSTAEVAPHPKQWDLVFTSHAPKGFRRLSYSSAKTHGGDPVAAFIVDALNKKRSDRVECLAFLSFGDGPDPWGAAAIRLREDEHYSTRDITPELVRDHPEQALGHLLFLLAWGKPVHLPFARRLTAYTIRTGDPTPWQPLMARPLAEQKLVVKHYLEQPKRPKPTPALLYSISMARPRGTLTDIWARALLEWGEHTPLSEVSEDLLLTMLYRDQMPQEPTSRATLWTLVLQRMISQCRFDDARRLFRHPATQRLINSDVARVVAMGWLGLPSSHMDAVELVQVVDRLDDARDGDRAARLLADTLHRQNQTELATAVVQQWSRVQSRKPPRAKDALLQWISGGPYARDWVGEMARFAQPENLASWIQPLTEGSRDSLWTFAEATRYRILDLAPRERLINSLAFFPHGGQAIEQAMRRMLNSLTFNALPDADIAHVAMTFSNQMSSGAIWRFLACIASPESHPDQERDALMNLAQSPPTTNAEQMVCKNLARALGLQDARTDEQHARWLRTVLESYTARPSEFTIGLAHWLATGLSQRDPDGIHFANVTNVLSQDSDDSPILSLFLQQVIPAVWPAGAPSGYVQAVNQELMSNHVLGLWKSTVFSTSRPPPQR